MSLLTLRAVVPAVRLRLATINDQGISWPSTIYSGYVVLDRDPTVPAEAEFEATEAHSFVIPDSLAATRAPKQPALVELSIRAVRSQPEPGPLHVGAYDVSIDFVPDPSRGANLWPQLSFQVPAAGVEHVELNYRVVVEDA